MAPLHAPPVIVPAAGLGTRLLPLTADRPKEMLPLGGRPAMVGSLLEAEAAGIREVVVVTGPGKESLEAWLNEQDEGGAWPFSIALARQPAPLGVLDAVERGRALLGGPRRYVVLFPDYVHLPSQRGLAELLAGAGDAPGTWFGLLRRTPERDARMGRTAAAWTEPAPRRGSRAFRIAAIGPREGRPPHHTTFAELRCAEHQARIDAGPRDDARVGRILGDLAGDGLLYGVELSPELLDLGVRPGYDDAVARFAAGARWRER